MRDKEKKKYFRNDQNSHATGRTEPLTHRQRSKAFSCKAGYGREFSEGRAVAGSVGGHENRLF